MNAAKDSVCISVQMRKSTEAKRVCLCIVPMFGNNTEKFVFHQCNHFPLQLYLSTRSLPKSNHTFMIHHRRCLRLAWQTICIHFVEMIMHAIALDTSKTNRLFKPHRLQHVILRWKNKEMNRFIWKCKIAVWLWKLYRSIIERLFFLSLFALFSFNIIFSANCVASEMWYHWMLVCHYFWHPNTAYS